LGKLLAGALKLAEAQIWSRLFPVKPFLFQASTPLAAPPQAVFAFHENPRNIARIAPPSLRIQLVECNEHAAPGADFRIRASQFGMPIDWTGRWETVEPPRLLVDVSVRSPFAHWRHSHIFDPHPSGTLMTDRVECLLKGGLAGALATHIAMPLVFAGMFRARHNATRKFFAGQ
jgi:ligand-binding SRPBCC domain-containing protein